MWLCSPKGNHGKMTTSTILAIIKDLLHGGAFITLLYTLDKPTLMSFFKYHGNCKDTHMSFDTFEKVLRYGSIGGLVIALLFGWYFYSKASLHEKLHKQN